MAMDPSWGAVRGESPPRKVPMGVRAAPTMTTSRGMVFTPAGDSLPESPGIQDGIVTPGPPRSTESTGVEKERADHPVGRPALGSLPRLLGQRRSLEAITSPRRAFDPSACLRRYSR